MNIVLPLALHIGYHKTATTFLQNNVFSHHPDILYLGRPYIDDSIKAALRELKFAHDLNFDGNRIRQEILKNVNIDSVSHKKLIMSSLESLH